MDVRYEVEGSSRRRHSRGTTTATYGVEGGVTEERRRGKEEDENMEGDKKEHGQTFADYCVSKKLLLLRRGRIPHLFFLTRQFRGITGSVVSVEKEGCKRGEESGEKFSSFFPPHPSFIPVLQALRGNDLG